MPHARYHVRLERVLLPGSYLVPGIVIIIGNGHYQVIHGLYRLGSHFVERVEFPEPLGRGSRLSCHIRCAGRVKDVMVPAHGFLKLLVLAEPLCNGYGHMEEQLPVIDSIRLLQQHLHIIFGQYAVHQFRRLVIDCKIHIIRLALVAELQHSGHTPRIPCVDIVVNLRVVKSIEAVIVIRDSI